jgi:catechol 2,3-dioxygenase-like lactoylglutathione lyase family enzyme
MSPVFTHIALHVEDIEASVAFYQDFCGLKTVECREPAHVYWLAEPGRERELIFVLIPGGEKHAQAPKDYSHFGFALTSREDVDLIAAKAREAGHLVWEPVEEPYPVGYYCGIKDPDGHVIEFSYGQPLGPGVSEDKESTTSR